MKKLIPAIVMLLVSAVVLSTASYAWFTTSNTTNVSGMSVTAQAPSSILIRGISSKTDAGAANWTQFGSQINFADSMAAVDLMPTSSADGKAFFTPLKASDTAGGMDLNTPINEDDANYVEYNIELKNDAAAYDSSDATYTAAKIALQSLTGSENSLKGAVRVAILVSNTTGASTTTVPADTDCTSFVYMLDLATSTTYVMYPEAGDAGNTKYENRATGALATEWDDSSATAFVDAAKGVSVDFADAEDVLVTLAPQQCVQMKIRIWFEGQDAACVSANSGQGSDIGLVFVIKGTETVTNPDYVDPDA